MMLRIRRIAVVVFAVLLAGAAARELTRLGDAAPWRAMDELPDFYCAGAAVAGGASPYTYEPLRSCEHRVNSGSGFRARFFAGHPSFAVPAPQPPYDFLAFALLSRMPFSAVRPIAVAAILAAVALTVAALGGLGISLALSSAALALSTAYVELNTGQVVPLSLLALTLCGLALARGRDALAGVLAVIVAIEPTAGIPVVAATLLYVPRARVAAGATALALLLISILLVGPAGVERYLGSVLPAHAASELRFPFQYSLTYVLAHFGASAPVAIAAGGISYVVLLAIGLTFAPRSAAALARRELLVFVPALCAVIGGEFLHQEELCFAIPALLVFAANAQRFRTLAAFALCLLAIPWILVWSTAQLILPSLFVCFLILNRLRVEVWAGIGIFCCIAAALYALELHPARLPVPAASSRVYAPDALVQSEWRDYAAARATGDPLWFAIKLPAWIALLAALATAARMSFRPPPASAPSPESLHARLHPPQA